MSNFNNDLKEREHYTVWRKRNKVKLKDVAEYLKISIPAVSRWERYEMDFFDNKQELYDKFIAEFKRV